VSECVDKSATTRHGVVPQLPPGVPQGSGELFSVSFFCLLITQFLTAANDNILRWLVIGLGKDYVDPGGVGMILMTGTVCFVVPYLFLASLAGYLADRFSKRSVIVGCKFAEIAIMLLGVFAIRFESLLALMAVVALMGSHSALFAPAKMGSIPELLRPRWISAANGLFGLTSVSATALGMAVGSWLSDVGGFRGKEQLVWIAAVLLGVAVVGALAALGIQPVAVANPCRGFPWNTLGQTYRDLRLLFSHGFLLRAAWGVVFFWSVAALAQLNIDQFAAEGGALDETAKVPLLLFLVAGVGLGSILAGLWSAGRIELGILPLGATGIALSSMLLFTVQGTIIAPETVWTFGYIVACSLLFLLGCSAGLFSVPLDSFLQHRSPVESRGAILAAVNFLTFAGVLLSALLYGGLRLPLDSGSLRNIPDSLRGGPVSAAEQQQIAERVAAFETAWKSSTTPELEVELRGWPVELQKRGLSELLWVEFQQRRARGEFIEEPRYLARFPADKRLVHAVYEQSTNLPLFSSQQIFLLAGLLTIPVLFYIVWLIPQATLRFAVWLLANSAYRIRIYGQEHLPERGGALLIPNHVSWIDGILLMLTSSRPIRMMVWEGNFHNRFLKMLADQWGAIMVGENPKMIVRAFKSAREALAAGELVCIFAEGGISRTGILQSFKPGMMKVLQGTGVPVVPVYLDGLWGSIFSFERGRFFWKWPKRWPYPIQIHFGPPLPHPDEVSQVRRAVESLGAAAVTQRAHENVHLVPQFIRACRRRGRQWKVADSTGVELSGYELLLRTLILRRLLRRSVLAANETHVGVLLPPSAGGAICNMVLAIDRRISVNLNYTVSSDVMNECIRQAGIRHVLTSRKFMSKMNLQLHAEVVYLEDFRDQLTLTDKIVSAIQAYVVPRSLLASSLPGSAAKPDEELTIIFTSGSTGVPKGVMLTHANIATQVETIEQVVRISAKDVLLGILPFFHSFGYTVTLWTIMQLDARGVYHFNPLDAQVGKLCEKYGGTILLSTPTFLRTYLRRCTREQFQTLDAVVAGAEKLPRALCDAFEEKFGVRPVEGYGCTELSPLVSVNVPPSRSPRTGEMDLKEGSVGRPVPGVSAKVVDLETGRELGTNQPGMLLITGPNVMKGYLGRDDLTASVMHDGWYETGDIARIDEEGFIFITGRESRFSKIGGEMVPHIQIEEALNHVVPGRDEGVQVFAVTAVPDEKKGERLIAVHTPISLTPQEVQKLLMDANLPNLYIPSADSFLQVPALPVLGTGKLDLKALQNLARERFSGTGDSTS
jgi:1-acyl-sn-glycerol-3-phosphate acyltransferase